MNRLRDKDLYTTTRNCLQCRIQMMYTVFRLIGVYVKILAAAYTIQYNGSGIARCAIAV